MCRASPHTQQQRRDEATRDAAEEPLLSSFLYASILAHDSFERALAFVLSNRLASAVMLPTQLFEIFHNVLASERDVLAAALADVQACRERDPACCSYSQALLYYKGYHALQTHRIAHALWGRGQRVLAVSLQSRVSEVLAVDIHPAARLGRGILLDHGTGVVIGETAVVGNNVSLLQNVTLGGTGKEVGDRHPKISDNVLIGASATVLGNITVGRGAQIAAGSLVLKPVPPHTMVAGSPAKPVGKLFGNPALDMQQWSRKFRDDGDGGGAGSASSAGAGAGAGSSASSGGVGASSSGGSVGDSGEGVAGGSGSSSSSGGAALNGTGGGSSSSSSGGAGSLAGAPAWSSGGGANGHDHGVNGTAIPQHAAKTPVTLLSHAADGPAPLRGVYDVRARTLQTDDVFFGPCSLSSDPRPRRLAQRTICLYTLSRAQHHTTAPHPLSQGDVDATMDEEAAASLWGDNSSDPEYVI